MASPCASTLHLHFDVAPYGALRARVCSLNVTNLGDEYTPDEARTIRIFERLESEIRRSIMSAADDAVKAAVDQLNKALAEVQAQDASQAASIVSPESVQALKDVAQQFDDLNPDAPAPEPVPEPTPEPTP